MSRRNHLATLREASPAVLPSLLMCDYAHLQSEVDRLEAAGVAALHLDVMDGHFVPNLSYGLPLVEAFRKMTRLPLDVLVMSVMPGFGGQQFDRRALDKLRELRPLVGPDVLLEIDGGVHESTIADCTAAGAQLLVVGSGIFKSGDYAAAVGHLTELAGAPDRFTPHGGSSKN
jgi:pentose-5-phosphate-3-epimerase